ncbi:MAG: hypothetical protein ACLSB9_31140 [Hydrogeniiclostridium mannosilyticum]
MKKALRQGATIEQVLLENEKGAPELDQAVSVYPANLLRWPMKNHQSHHRFHLKDRLGQSFLATIPISATQTNR